MKSTRILSLIAAGAAVTALAFAQEAGHNRPKPEQMHRYEEQTVAVEDFEAKGWILDIGGGGEGVIGVLKGTQVVAIDLFKRELAEAPPGPLKIQMDATDMKFLDGTFPTVTSFFTLMYMKPDVQEKAFKEIFRVLAPGGKFLVWDVILPKQFDPVKSVAIYRFLFKLPKDKVIKTGYGTFFPEQPQDLGYFLKLAEKTGFQVIRQQQQDRNLYLELRKPV